MPSKHKDKQRAKQADEPIVFPRSTQRFTVAIVGGGASGIATACSLAACVRAAQLDVRIVLVEAGRRLGSSILRSGNGRCNFSHVDIGPEAFNQPQFVGRSFDALEQAFDGSCLSDYAGKMGNFRENAVLHWFAQLGLVWREAPQSGGLLYPFSNKASSVLEVLQAELDRLDVEQCCGIAVSALTAQEDRFSLELRSACDETEGSYLAADRVVYACGGATRALPLQESILDDLKRVPSASVLGPLRTDTRFLSGLDGVRARVRLSCERVGFSEEGELLFRTYGVSGIVVFNASRFVEEGDVITLDFVPERPLERLTELLLRRADVQARRRGAPPTYAELLRGFFLPEVVRMFVSYRAQDPSGHDLHAVADEAGIKALARVIKSFELEVKGCGSADQCQVSRGGIAVDAVDPETMEAFLLPGIYVTGEALDVDGPCGGYNLHWAWASGLLAGLSIAQELARYFEEQHNAERLQRL